MPTLSEIPLTNDAPQVPDVEIPEYDPMVLLQAQAAFGGLVSANADITRLINAYGPVLFATLLFTMSENYEVDPNDADNLIATNSVVEAESKAIGILRGVANAMGKLEGDLTTEPSDSEVDTDTELNPV